MHCLAGLPCERSACRLIGGPPPLPCPRFSLHSRILSPALRTIRAIERGQWVLLDSANLCNPTVLDRLNPLLEPQGERATPAHAYLQPAAQVAD